MMISCSFLTHAGVAKLADARNLKFRGLHHVGSIPTGPTENALVVQRRGYRTRNAVTRVRVPPDALLFFENSAHQLRP